MKKSFFIFLLCLIIGSPIFAHANLEKSSPAANASLSEAPSEIRLWFTEPVEPTFSKIILRSSSGDVIETSPSHVDPTDNHQLMLGLSELPADFYTITWRVVSAADGHSSEGNFVFGLNMGSSAMPSTDSVIDESVAPLSAAIRTLHFLAMCLAIGSLGFFVFVWPPSESSLAGVSVLRLLMAVGWLSLGLASVLFLMLQTSTVTDLPILETLTSPAMTDLLAHTIFGSLWLIRMLLWGIWGAVLFFNRRSYTRYGEALALVLGAGFLLAQSLFSHASATQDRAAIGADWLHLTATTLWVGGLIAFLTSLIALRHDKANPTGQAAVMVSRFSNYARVCVVLLIITGLYASWIQVGSLEALLGTRYGQALVMKLLLFVPLLGLAAINFLWTHRQLQQGQALWVGHLRGLIGAEITLTCGILAVVGIMTAGSPARGIQALRESAHMTAPAPDPYFEMETAGQMMIHLAVEPGTVGQNEFRVSLADMSTNAPIDDASLIRLRFENLKEDYGISEVRPTLTQNGEYVVRGANLSAPGEWRIRVNIQRANQFDIVKDFTIKADLVPSPVPVDARPPLELHLLASLLMGAALLTVGGFLGGWRTEGQGLVGSRVLGAAAILVGLVSLSTTTTLFNQLGGLTVSDAYARPAQPGMTAAVYFTISNQALSGDQLISVEADIAGDATLHETQVNNDLAEMVALTTIDIPPFSTIKVEPSSTHVMLEGVTQALEVGDTFEVRLTFASGKTLPVEVTVQDP